MDEKKNDTYGDSVTIIDRSAAQSQREATVVITA